MFGLVGWFCFVCLVWFGKKMFLELPSPHSAMIELNLIRRRVAILFYLFVFVLFEKFIFEKCFLYCTGRQGM